MRKVLPGGGGSPHQKTRRMKSEMRASMPDGLRPLYSTRSDVSRWFRNLAAYRGRRQLQNCRVLSFWHECQQNDPTIWEFQRIVMSSWIMLVHLPEDSCFVFRWL